MKQIMSDTQYIAGLSTSGRHSTAPWLPLKNGYALDNVVSQAGDRFGALTELFDPGTIRHLEQRGVASGWHCLEVGGGGGSIATWLSDRVGPAGRVVVTDINTRFLDTLKRPNLEVNRHNIVTDQLPEATFDLVHARIVLMHLPERDAVLARLCKALKPGGWLLDEEFDVLSLHTDPNVNPSEPPLHAFFALNQVLAERGVHLRFGRLLYGRLRALGLAEIGADARLSAGSAGSAVGRLVRSTYDQLRDAMIEGGHVSPDELAQDLRRLEDPDSLILTPTLWSVWGRRPQSAPCLSDAEALVGAEAFIGAGI
jgi:SAM-dependent methyltransferase